MERGVVIPTPARIQVVSPSSGGKTTLITKLLTSNILQPPPQKIFLVYSFYQPNYDILRKAFADKIIFLKSLPANIESEEFLSNNKNSCLVLDDCLSMQNNEVLLKLVTEASHHANLTVILLQQSLFPNTKYSKMISDQMTDLFLFRNPRDSSRLKCFALQCFPREIHQFMSAFDKATENPFGYIWVSLGPCCPKLLQLRANIFEEHGKYLRIYPLYECIGTKTFSITNGQYTECRNNG